MTTTLQTVALTLAATLPLASRSQEDGVEPPQRFFLEMGGEKLAIQIDRPFEIEVDGKRHELVLRASATRHFVLSDLSFEYPSFMAFEADFDSPGVDVWTLDGNACVLQVMRFEDTTDAETSLADLVDSTLEALDADADRADDQLALGGRDWKGVKLWVRFGDVPVEYSFYALATAEDVYVLSVLDTLTDEDERTEEAAEVLRLLKATFRME